MNSLLHTHFIYETASFKEDQSIVYSYIIEKIHTMHFYLFKIIIKAYSFTCVAMNETASRTAWLLWQKDHMYAERGPRVTCK